jgi:hypothetical protein
MPRKTLCQLKAPAPPNQSMGYLLTAPSFPALERFQLNRSNLNLNRSRRLTNQDAFDSAMLSLLNQGRSCSSTGGRARYRGPRGKSAIGALIPDDLYAASMEGKNVHHWLAARGSEYDALRERLGGVTPTLLDELQDLHDRIGACMPSLYRQLAVAGAQRIAQSFKLSMRLVYRCAAYQSLRGPQLFWAAAIRPVPVAVPAVAVAPTPDLAAARAVDVAPTLPLTAAPAIDVSPTPGLAAAPAVNIVPIPDPAAAPAVEAAPTLPLAAAPVPAAQPQQLKESPQNDLELIARGIAKAIAAARGHDQPGS